MDSKLWIRKILSMCLVVAMIATYSMVTLANSEKVVAELSISGNNINGQSPLVKVNGETVQSGRSLFSSSTVATPENASAIINFGKVGKIELAPNTTLALSFDKDSINGDLLNGRVTVLSAAANVNITTTDGNLLNLVVGESVTATGGKAQTGSSGSNLSLLVTIGVIAASLAAVVISATSSNSVGGGSSVSSPR
ncbi:MAG: hypothetical protein M3Q33_02775 [Acidobacteriota bacterium]|nr:hypothetical protein [Acidobacteriota bacterium]